MSAERRTFSLLNDALPPRGGLLLIGKLLLRCP